MVTVRLGPPDILEGAATIAVTTSGGSPVAGPHLIRRYSAAGTSIDTAIANSNGIAVFPAVSVGVEYFYRLSPNGNYSILLNEPGYNTPAPLSQPSMVGPGLLTMKV